MKRLTLATFSLFVTLVFSTSPIFAQTPKPKSAATQAAKPKPVDKFKKAQRDTDELIGLLRAYIAENPTGKNVDIAKIQLVGLENLTQVSIPVAFTDIRYSVNSKVQWRVVSAEVKDERTVVLLEIFNPTENRDQNFINFVAQPLTIVDNNGKVYPMKSAPDLPEGVRENEKEWVLQPGQKITVKVEFSAMIGGASGIVKYVQPYDAGQPAKFSLLNERQKPAEK